MVIRDGSVSSLVGIGFENYTSLPLPTTEVSEDQILGKVDVENFNHHNTTNLFGFDTYLL